MEAARGKRSARTIVPAIPEQAIVDAILKMAGAELIFAPRFIASTFGLPVDQVRVHCQLLAQVGKLGPTPRHGETWYRKPVLRQAELALPKLNLMQAAGGDAPVSRAAVRDFPQGT